MDDDDNAALFVTQEIVDQSIKIANDKNKNIIADRVYFNTVKFGRCVQCFHSGDYNKINDTLVKMQEFAAKLGFSSDQYTQYLFK